MRRFYCPELTALRKFPVSADEAAPAMIELSREESHHARRVLRFSAGDEVELFDGRGLVATGVLDDSPARRPVGIMVRQVAVHPPPTPTLELAVAWPKGGRGDDMVSQLSQLGVDTLSPLVTHHGVAAPSDGRLEKYRRVCIESAKQCDRTHLMAVEAAVTLAYMFAQQHDARLIADSNTPDANTGSSALTFTKTTDQLRNAQRVLVLIGPEGGWTDQERHEAIDGGCVAWSLGPNVLRIETAAAAAAAVVRHAPY